MFTLWCTRTSLVKFVPAVAYINYLPCLGPSVLRNMFRTPFCTPLYIDVGNFLLYFAAIGHINGSEEERAALPRGKEIWREERCFDSRGFEVGRAPLIGLKMRGREGRAAAAQRRNSMHSFSDGAIYLVSLLP